MKYIILIYIALSLVACASGREFWTFVVEEPVSKPLIQTNADAPIPIGSSSQFVKVNFNDGSTSTEVSIPVLTTGQQIIIDHKNRKSDTSLKLVPLPPVEADQSLEEAYLREGGSINKQSSPVSLVKTQGEIRKLVKQGNYSLALEYASQLLARYPNHVETLRTKGSILLKMGEKSAALEAYEKAQEIQPSTKVQKQIEAIQKNQELNQ